MSFCVPFQNSLLSKYSLLFASISCSVSGSAYIRLYWNWCLDYNLSLYWHWAYLQIFNIAYSLQIYIFLTNLILYILPPPGMKTGSDTWNSSQWKQWENLDKSEFNVIRREVATNGLLSNRPFSYLRYLEKSHIIHILMDLPRLAALTRKKIVGNIWT